jgi:hypothetical protein
MPGERRPRIRDAIVTPRRAALTTAEDGHPANGEAPDTIAQRRRVALRIAPPSPNRTQRGRAARRRALARAS